MAIVVVEPGAQTNRCDQPSRPNGGWSTVWGLYREAGYKEPTSARLGPGGFPLAAAGWRVEGGKPAAKTLSVRKRQLTSPTRLPASLGASSGEPRSEATSREPSWCGPCLETG